jgi:uncharacterized repeat protein (TIGR03809 family)
MSGRSFAPAFDEVAQRWRALAERRRAHFIELFQSGRWRHYYSEQQFLDSLRDAVRISERWAEIAPPPATEVAAEQFGPDMSAARRERSSLR